LNLVFQGKCSVSDLVFQGIIAISDLVFQGKKVNQFLPDDTISVSIQEFIERKHHLRIVIVDFFECAKVSIIVETFLVD
jgi:hypothetical protein